MVAGSSRELDWILNVGALAFVVLLGFVSSSTMDLTESLKWLLGGLLPIGIVVAIASVAWYLGNRPTTPTAKELALRFEAVRSMTGAQFEVFTADTLEPTLRLLDRAADLLAVGKVQVHLRHHVTEA